MKARIVIYKSDLKRRNTHKVRTFNLWLAATFFCLFSIECSASSNKLITLEWDGDLISEADINANETVRAHPETWVTKKPQVDCVFDNMRARCWKIQNVRYSKKHQRPYGVNLRLVQPIAVTPVPYNPENNGDTNEDETPNPIWSGDEAKIIAYARTLAEFEFKKLSAVEVDQVLNANTNLGPDSVSHAFTPADATIGGQYALELWQSLVGKLPTRTCYSTTEGDLCSVVLKARRNKEEALVYCAIASSKFGLGYPFDCGTVAFVRSGRWYVYSYDSPEQCDGCGAGFGATCEIETDRTPDAIASVFLSAMKNGKTNIELKEVERTDNSIQLVGKKIAVDSKFYSGYYEKASANYTIKNSSVADQKSITIDGLFILLISAEPSKDSTDYREVRDGDLEWIQNQVFSIIRDKVGKSISSRVMCHILSL